MRVATDTLNGPSISGPGRSTAYYVALILIFAVAAYARLRLPLCPFADPDTTGYLAPAVLKLAGETFKHTNSRNFLYPGFLLLILGSTSNFAAIALVQHLLGLATGGLILRCWTITGQFIRHIPLQVHDLGGLVIVATYLLARQSIGFEHEIRPEAITPFFAIFNILLTLLFFQQRHRDRPTCSGALYSAGILVNSVILATLKPAFTLSVFFSVIPVLIALFDRRQTWPGRTLIVLAGLTAMATVTLTERALAKSDIEAKTFLPTTLFAVHAHLIVRQMDEDIARGNCDSRGCAWLTEVDASLHEELGKSHESGKIFPSLGFDPDYLMYGDSHRRWRTRFFKGSYDEEVDFYMEYYLRTARIHPGWMVEKVIRQMALFYLAQKHLFVTSPRAQLGKLYAQTVDSLRALAASTPPYPPFALYLNKCERLSSSGETISQPLLIRGLGGLLSLLYPPVLFASLATASLLKGDLRRFYGRLAAVTLFAFSYNFGNCLLTAIVHSLDLTRYVVTQYSFGLLSECIGILFLVEVLLECRAISAVPPSNRSQAAPS